MQTRRNFAAPNSRPQATAVGQRRPISNNFIPGGQLVQNNQGGVTLPQQQPPPQQQLRQQSFDYQPQSNTTNEFQQPNQQQFQPPIQQPIQQQTQQPEVKGEPMYEQSTLTAKEEGDAKKEARPSWMKPLKKISRKERIQRRNKKLVKILQPKNAIMVLNEMVPNVTYNVMESPDLGALVPFKASVVLDGVEHVGVGKSKMAAKAAAAELAIKQLVLTRFRSSPAATQSLNKKDELVYADDANDEMSEASSVSMDESLPLPWQHVASFALHKLLLNWGDGKIKDKFFSCVEPTESKGQTTGAPEKKPAKKMPDNPELMNPIMLLNQMVPNAVFELVSETGQPPNMHFKYKCNIGLHDFYGGGSSKKLAKKLCAYEACKTILNINYPPEIYSPQEVVNVAV